MDTLDDSIKTKTQLNTISSEKLILGKGFSSRKEQFQKKLKSPITELGRLYLFKMAANQHYIIPHIDIGTHSYNTGQQIKRRRTNSDCEEEESESEWE